MDPNANIAEQREIARGIAARPRTIMTGGDDGDRYSVLDSAQRLAELVLAYDPLPADVRAEIKSALDGDSNDAEHDALATVADHFGIEVE